MKLYRILSFLLCFSLGGLSLFSQEKSLVEVDRVDFRLERLGQQGNWLKATITVRSNGDPDAKTPAAQKFASNVRMVLSLAYQGASDSEFFFYKAEATAVALEGGRTYDYAFYLPYDVLNRRDGIRRDPFGYLVELFVGDREMPLTQKSVDGRNVKPDTLQSFRDRSGRESSINEGILVPAYVSPFWNPRLAETMPAFLVKQVN